MSDNNSFMSDNNIFMSDNKYGLDYGKDQGVILSKTELRRSLGESVENTTSEGSVTYIPSRPHLRWKGVFMMDESAARLLSILVNEIGVNIIDEKLKGMGYSDKQIEIIIATISGIDSITPILDEARKK